MFFLIDIWVIDDSLIIGIIINYCSFDFCIAQNVERIIKNTLHLILIFIKLRSLEGVKLDLVTNSPLVRKVNANNVRINDF